MKKRFAIFCTMIACVCSLMISGCGKSQQESTDSSTADETASKSAPVATADNEFLGHWVLAVVKTEGLTITGDFSLFFQNDETISIDIEDDWTATMSFGSTDVDFTWEETDEGGLRVISSAEEDDSAKDAEGVLGEYDTANLTLDGDSIVMVLGEEEEASTELIFTSDGTLKGYESLTGNGASDISSSDDLVGEWMLSGLSISTMTIYGSAEDLAEMVGAGADTSMMVFDDGTGTVMGSDFTWKTENGTTVFDYDGSTMTVKSLDGDIILDMTSMLGGEVVTVMRFTK